LLYNSSTVTQHSLNSYFTLIFEFFECSWFYLKVCVLFAFSLLCSSGFSLNFRTFFFVYFFVLCYCIILPLLSIVTQHSLNSCFTLIPKFFECSWFYLKVCVSIHSLCLVLQSSLWTLVLFFWYISRRNLLLYNFIPLRSVITVPHYSLNSCFVLTLSTLSVLGFT